MIAFFILTLLGTTVKADVVRMHDENVFQGIAVRADADVVEVKISREMVDPDDLVGRAAGAKILILKDGTVVHGAVVSIGDDAVTVRIERARVASVDYAPSGAAMPSEKIGGPAAAAPASARPAPVWQDAPPTTPSTLNEFHLNAGGFVPVSKLTLQGTDKLAGPGYAVGGQYLRQTSRGMAVGFGVQALNGGSYQSTALITNGYTTSQFDSIVAMALVRLTDDEGKLRLHLTAGVGLDSTNIQINTRPQPGYTWLDTGTAETRGLVNSTETGAAFMLQPEVDFYLSDTVWAGAGAAYYYFASTSYQATPAAQNLGLGSINGALSGVELFGSVNLRF